MSVCFVHACIFYLAWCSAGLFGCVHELCITALPQCMPRLAGF